MPSISTKANLRVVELFKTSPNDMLCDQIKSSDANDPNECVCFGHFDRLHIRDVPREGDLLSDIDRDIQNQLLKSNYYYPFYIFHYSEQGEAPDKLTLFWDAKLCCMVVSRIHFTPLIPGEEDDQLSNTDHLLKSLGTLSDATPSPEENCCIGDKTVAIAGELVHCVFYHTLELGDLVVVLKSNSMESCLRVQQRLSETAAVGDMYSYCGIHSSFFQTEYSTDEIAKQWDADGSVYQLRSTVDSIHQKLSHMSVRYSIRSVSCAKRFWDDLKYPLSFVTGTADALTDLNGKKLKDLIHVSRVLLSSCYPRGDDPGDDFFNMYDAFDDIITRIGIKYEEVYPHTRDPKDKHYSNRVGSRLRNSLEPLLQKKARWIGPLATQTYILLTMMYDCVLDDLSILIWPSVEALIDRLYYLCTSGNKIYPEQEGQIESFLNCWDILANDITRLESQLTQSPQLQSSRYYIPATLMIFYMALLDQYTDLLLELDKKEDQKRYVPLRYVPLITYGLEPRTSTVCILDPCTDGVSDENAYDKDVPLLVSLPTTLMYKPYLVSGILCHELAHYTGDTSRLREVRLEQILTSAAGMIAYAWGLDGIAYPLRPGSSEKIITEIEKELRARYENQLQIVGLNSGDYIYQIQSALPPAFKAVYFSRDLQTSLLSRYLDSNVMYLDFITYAKSFTPSKQNRDIQVLEKQLADLLQLYRECYADLVAVLCLGLNKEQYLLFMFWAENQYLSDRSPDKKHIFELHYQAAMVLNALDSVDYSPYSDWPEPSEEEKKWLDEWGEHVDYYCDAIKEVHKGPILTDEPEPRLFALQSQCIPLIRYLQRCAEVISGPLIEPEVKQLRDKIKEMLMTVSGEPDFAELQKIIAQYRTDLFKDE